MDGGVALVLYWSFHDEEEQTKSVNQTRGNHGSSSRNRNMAGFEKNLEGSTFCLRSEDERGIVTEIPLKRIQHERRDDDAQKVLCGVTAAWEKIMSPYSFELEYEADHAKLIQRADWILQLQSTRESEVYKTQQAVFPQQWLSRLSDGWLSANAGTWNWETGDCFGIPTADSVRKNTECEAAKGRKHFTFISIPNDTQTEMGKGSQALAESSKALLTEYSTSTAVRTNFPAQGQIYVIPFNLPTTYRIGRELAQESAWECVLCFENGAQGDGGVYFGACGHYICGGCCTEPGFMEKLNAAKACYCCRRPARIKLKHGDCFPPSKQQLNMQAKCHGGLDVSVAQHFNGTETRPVTWALQLYKTTQDKDFFDICYETAHVETTPLCRCRYQVEPDDHYLVSIWNVSAEADQAHNAIYSIWYTGDNYSTIDEEEDKMQVDPNERFCTPFPIQMEIFEDLNAWIIKDASQNEVLRIEFECTGAKSTQVVPAVKRAQQLNFMLSQLKAVLDV